MQFRKSEWDTNELSKLMLQNYTSRGHCCSILTLEKVAPPLMGVWWMKIVNRTSFNHGMLALLPLILRLMWKIRPYKHFRNLLGLFTYTYILINANKASKSNEA